MMPTCLQTLHNVTHVLKDLARRLLFGSPLPHIGNNYTMDVINASICSEKPRISSICSTFICPLLDFSSTDLQHTNITVSTTFNMKDALWSITFQFKTHSNI